MNQEVTNARRMAQTAWMALALYTVFGFHQLGGPEIQVLDKKINLQKEIKLNILIDKIFVPKKLLDFGFPLFSLYALMVFGFYGFIASQSPGSKRKHWIKNQTAPLPKEILPPNGPIHSHLVKMEIAKLFPGLEWSCIQIDTAKRTGQIELKNPQTIHGHNYCSVQIPKLPFCVKVWITLDSLHYSYPLWLNILAQILFWATFSRLFASLEIFSR